jgi:hypothetical protein
VSDRLNRALESLITEGKVSAELANEIRLKYQASGDRALREEQAEHFQSRRSILAEIGGYLGGIFTAVAATILLSSQWDRLTKTGQVSIFVALAVILALAAYRLNYVKGAQRRVAGLLFPASALATTAALGTIFGNDGPYSLAFLAGALVALFGYLRVQTQFGHVALYVGLFATLVAANEQIFNRNLDYPLLISWLALASLWLWLTVRLTLQEHFWGYLLSMGTYFIAAQYLQIQDQTLLYFALSSLTTALGIWLYLQTRKWPLLIGALAIATFAVGTFIIDTFNGALGAALALLVGGLILIGGSLLALRSDK